MTNDQQFNLTYKWPGYTSHQQMQEDARNHIRTYKRSDNVERDIKTGEEMVNKDMTTTLNVDEESKKSGPATDMQHGVPIKSILQSPMVGNTN